MGDALKEVESVWGLRKLSKKHRRVLIVSLYSEECHSCLKVKSYFQELSEEFRRQAKFARMCVDNNEEVLSSLDLYYLPAFISMYEGDQLDRYVGTNEEKIRDFVQTSIAKSQDLKHADSLFVASRRRYFPQRQPQPMRKKKTYPWHIFISTFVLCWLYLQLLTMISP